MFFFCLTGNTVPENGHICVNKGPTYLHPPSLRRKTEFAPPNRGRFCGDLKVGCSTFKRDLGIDPMRHLFSVRASIR